MSKAALSKAGPAVALVAEMISTHSLGNKDRKLLAEWFARAKEIDERLEKGKNHNV